MFFYDSCLFGLKMWEGCYLFALHVCVGELLPDDVSIPLTFHRSVIIDAHIVCCIFNGGGGVG